MPNNNKNKATLNYSENLIKENGFLDTLKRGMSKKFSKKKNTESADSQNRFTKLEDPYFITKNSIEISNENNLEGNFTTNTVQNMYESSDPDDINSSLTHNLNILNFSSNDQSKANNIKNGVFEVTKGTDVKSATTRPLPAIPLSDEEIFNKIILSNFGDAIKNTITNPYELDDSQDELVYKIFITLVLHFAPDKNDDEILKKLFKDFKNFLENPYMSMNRNMNIPIQNNASDLSGCQNFNGFFSQKDSIKATDENQSEQTLKI